MFLLFPVTTLSQISSWQDLHSNMFLLFPAVAGIRYRYERSIYIPICFYYFTQLLEKFNELPEFTFQYVSIISSCLRTSRKCTRKFTFQYVSIISEELLQDTAENILFTFQYVSIISDRSSKDFPRNQRFTFQYVSIISRPM